ncbi:MAG: hypothetical protein WBE20_10695 [Candidatus Acidiferrales bacterium]
MDRQTAVVLNEAQPSEFIHEITNARPGCAYHFRQDLLADFRHNRFWFTFFTVAGEQKESASQPFFTGVEKLVDKVRFKSNVAREDPSDEMVGKLTVIVEHADDLLLTNFEEARRFHGFGGGHAQWLACDASFAQEITGSQDCDHGLSGILRHDHELDATLLNVKNRRAHVALRENGSILATFDDSFARPVGVQKFMKIKSGSFVRFHFVYTSPGHTFIRTTPQTDGL